MRKPLVFITGLTFAALAYSQVGTSTLLASFGKAINGATTVSSNYTFQTISKGGAESYSIALKKPDFARIETPTQLVVADGKEVHDPTNKVREHLLQAARDSWVSSRRFWRLRNYTCSPGSSTPMLTRPLKSKDIGLQEQYTRGSFPPLKRLMTLRIGRSSPIMNPERYGGSKGSDRPRQERQRSERSQ